MLDEEHPVLPAADPRDANPYLLGRVSDHNVVIACLPAETTGKVSAATVTDMIHSFPSIRFGLMVGIGGGVPHHTYPEQGAGVEIGEDDDESEDEMEEIPDIRLGDVVVSLHTKSTEAVVQYDFGKSLQEKEFVHTGGKLNAVARLQANHTRGHYKIPELLSKMLADNPSMANFQHPGSEKDRLFKADIIHVEAPKIHCGTIGSADQVMKNAILRDQWALKENILSVWKLLYKLILNHAPTKILALQFNDKRIFFW
ncbi:conserved hypothetical protein [Talaromyces stipitatus ATCC 10500]|uniref:Nucleoside phosphorylase domain-containing protein n=1 Tax=Talaromyces stipitatus (strain ATCC 10500 / CBS 375.48 / QM 6759 / NRRL 1006) TaxID=441959 RepID=B8LZ01_TALSN|nr:uncharacterized protein TSTA_069300 [Talaromyces stipitatus ATCC 10500]EED23509.1 conserved hypothetical protein [Talaromyces stipitatus ATCC 10500]